MGERTSQSKGSAPKLDKKTEPKHQSHTEETSKNETNQVLSTADKIAPGLRLTIILIICLIAFLVRVFAVVKYESIIHEYDPWFNYRSTEYLLNNGWYKFRYWIDNASWYPIGRYTGATLFPGLMMTAWLLHAILHNVLLLPVHIREVCVFTAPTFAALTAIATYLLTREVGGRPSAGLIAALLLAVMPTYMSRSVAGSYDNEAIAIFALVFSFFAFARSLRVGSLLSALGAAFAYFYMVLAWGGYVFVLCFFALFTVALVLLDRLDV